MADNIGYRDVEIPEDKDPLEYHYTQRRAEILKFILKAGHPDLVSRKMLQERYDVSHSQISQDFSAIRDSIAGSIGDDARLVTETVYRRATKELMRQNKYKDAARVVRDWNEWLFDVGVQEKAADKIEHSGNLANALTVEIVDPEED